MHANSAHHAADHRRRPRRLCDGDPRRQLGIPTILVEGQSLGGTCLNIGCIPSKALIHVAEQFHQTQHHNQHSALGISVSAPTLDIGKSVEWKDGIVDRLTTGVAALLKKNKVQVIQGWAKVIDGKTVEVGDTRIQCEHLVLATGSNSVNLPMLPIGGPIISSTEALAPKAVPNVWWWSAAVTSAWSWASPTASSAPRSAWSRRRIAFCRPTTPS
jgi:pyruvate/2-oxoglutarate dehydrogenase complex dihydrolipoamide dehydrogenase (E3) component